MGGKNSALYTATQWEAVAPSDTTIIPAGIRALYVGGAGNLTLEGQDGVIETFTGLAAGAVLPVQPRRVRAATTATLILALY